MDSNKQFQKELETFENEDIKENTKVLISLIPEYFFKEAASSSGKYHPSFAQNEGGLLRHTKVACRIANEILNNPIFKNFYTSRERDLIRLAILMHDSVKRGNNEAQTRFDHPLLASNLVLKNSNKLSLNKNEINELCNMISTHMGPWIIDNYTKQEVLKEPKTKCERLVHLCDYLSSKKFLDIKFDDNNNIID